jgi:UDP-glucose 4-epimerase
MAESHALAPVNPYGETKLRAERAIETVGPRFGLRWAVLRYFNVVGCDPSGELFEWHEPETHVVPSLLAAALAGREFMLFGGSYPTPDGSAVRDYVDVVDLARTHAEALDVLEREPRLVSNVGTGQGVSVRELVGLAERVTGGAVRVRVEPPRPGDPPRLVADNRHLLTWCGTARSGFTPLETSLRTALAALRSAPPFPQAAGARTPKPG